MNNQIFAVTKTIFNVDSFKAPDQKLFERRGFSMLGVDPTQPIVRNQFYHSFNDIMNHVIRLPPIDPVRRTYQEGNGDFVSIDINSPKRSPIALSPHSDLEGSGNEDHDSDSSNTDRSRLTASDKDSIIAVENNVAADNELDLVITTRRDELLAKIKSAFSCVCGLFRRH